MAVTYGERKFKKINGGGHMKAISIYVYKSSLGDCTNGGISAKYKTILLEHPRGNYDVDIENPPENFCKIVTRNLWGKEYKHIEPYAKAPGVGWMYGGNIASCSDSRFSDLSQYPLCIHDRTESQEMYDMLSR
jgi:hypothetical protein